MRHSLYHLLIVGVYIFRSNKNRFFLPSLWDQG